jgi:LysM repeat protein/ribosomal protein L40E
MDRYWKCPNCGAVLDKGEQFEAKKELYLSPPTTMGWVTCGGCGSSFDVRDVYAGRYDASGPPATREPTKGRVVICPKCQAQNPPERVTCSQCGTKLLPGRDILERIGYLISGIVGAALFTGLAWLFARMEMEEALPQCCASPITLGIMALICLVGGLVLAFGRTPEYEKYVKRAQRHVEAAPAQALADFTKALELAPEKQKADILKQRGELYSKLSRKEEALADLSAYATSPQAHKGAKVVSKIVGVELEEAAQAISPTEMSIQGLRTELVQEGALKAVGYCKRCKDAVDLDENQLCSRCGGKVKEPRFVKPEESEAELGKLRKEAAARRRNRLIWLTVAGVTLFACALCIGMGVWSSRMRKESEGATAAVTAVPTTFAENIFSFEYPSNWERITEEEISALLKTSLKGLQPGNYDYIGGVYIGGVGDCRGCAQIVIVVANDPSLTGTLTDEQYELVKEATEQQMGSRLISYSKTEVSSMPATESVHIGASRQSKLWELIVVPPEPGVAYLFTCSSHKDSYADFEGVFAQAIESLRIGETIPTSTPTVITYTVQAGDTLGKIAKEFGVTVEAIVEANDIEDPSLIQVGQVLVIPIAKPEE